MNRWILYALILSCFMWAGIIEIGHLLLGGL